jgi:hypothetical protein
VFVFLLDRQQGVLLTRFSGIVSNVDLINHRRRLKDIFARERLRSRIVDFSEVASFEASTETIIQLAAKEDEIERVFIVPRPEIFGLARLYATHNSLSEVRQPQLTRTFEEAVAWLDLARCDFQPFDP